MCSMFCFGEPQLYTYIILFNVLYGSSNRMEINGNATISPLFCLSEYNTYKRIIAVRKYGITRRKTRYAVIQLKLSKGPRITIIYQRYNIIIFTKQKI